LAKSQKQTRSNGEATRGKILDAAEALFGARGFDAVSLREITERADVTLALASYHFGTKEKLFEEVVARRAKILSDDRLARLRKLDVLTVEAVADSFMAPLFEWGSSTEPGWIDYFKVLGRLGEGNQWLGVLETYFNETAQVFIDAFCKALPDADRGDVTRSFMMMLNLMLSTVSQHERIDQLSGGALKARDMKAAYDPMLKFAVAGFKAAV
jgi:AcrR family transcriptional regulator